MPSDAEYRASVMLEQTIREEINKDFKDHFKEEEKSSKFFAHMSAPFNPRYMEFITTRSPKDIYWGVGTRDDVLRKDWWVFKVRAHEAMHMWDWKNHGILFSLGYLSPQVLSLLFLIVFSALNLHSLMCTGMLLLGAGIAWIIPRNKYWFYSWLTLGVLSCVATAVLTVGYWTLFLAGFVLLLSPVPNWLFLSYYRAWAEFRGYTITLACNYWKHASLKQTTVDRIVGNFTGSNYYFMLPYKKYVVRRINKIIASIEDGTVIDKNPWAAKVYHVMVKSGMAIIRYGDNS